MVVVCGCSLKIDGDTLYCTTILSFRMDVQTTSSNFNACYLSIRTQIADNSTTGFCLIIMSITVAI